jgi:hypothetical protein
MIVIALIKKKTLQILMCLLFLICMWIVVVITIILLIDAFVDP